MVMAFLNAAGWIAGLRIRTTGTRLRRDVLFVSNHVSWLDILALGGAARSAFVSKAEVEGVPLVGWLADQNHTIYVQREAKREIHNQANDLRNALAVIGNRFVQIYGQGESPMTITALSRAQLADRNHPRWAERMVSVGVAQSLVEVRVVDAAGQPMPA
eukprot:gene18511-23653_t